MKPTHRRTLKPRAIDASSLALIEGGGGYLRLGYWECPKCFVAYDERPVGGCGCGKI